MGYRINSFDISRICRSWFTLDFGVLIKGAFMYNYAECRKMVFTEEGTKKLLSISNNIKILCDVSGATTIGNAIATVGGDSFMMLACIDYLEELKEIKVHKFSELPTQCHFITCINKAKQ